MKPCPSLRFLGAVLLAMLSLIPAPRAHALDDPGSPGVLAVSKEEYNLGNSFATDPTFPYTKVTNFPGATAGTAGQVEFIGSVWYPSTAANSLVPLSGPFPLIVFMHGRHSVEYAPQNILNPDMTVKTPAGTAGMAWPPATGFVSIPSYEGYDYAGQVLASHGYIVISISANGINSTDNNTTDRGMFARAQLIQAHLDYWKVLNTTGTIPFGTKFKGVVDMTNIGTMGHSRGGEGVMRHAVFNADPVLNPEATHGPAYSIKAVVPIAPVDYNRFVVNNIPIGVMLPYCDGDVSDNQGMHFYDDARYGVPGDATPKYFVEVMGGDHNFFNTVWTPGLFPTPGAAPGFGGTADDWTGTPGFNLDAFAYLPNAQTPQASPKGGRLTSAQQEGVGLFYLLAFFRTYIGGETQYIPYLKGEVAPPASAMNSTLVFSYHAPDSAATRLDINRFLTPASLTTDAIGGAVSESGLSPFDVQGSGTVPEQKSAVAGQPAARQPSNTPSLYAPTAPGLSQLRLGWNTPGAFLENDIPAASGNVSSFGNLQFRAAVNFTDARNTAAKDDFSVVLTDSGGRTASVSAAAFSPALNFPPGRIVRIPKVVLSMVRIPLTAFTTATPALDLTHVTSVRLVFNRQASGSLLLTDLAFAN